ncbi:hypothetical protein [uncultured Clostridium sp.]|uniref:hypothetical protein n=1 Tax=uncultured Clostridium sp. TaxID=59620 RepID=UPI0026230E57|nr:hypothetical protein [uncultured Clostridium sp.]
MRFTKTTKEILNFINKFGFITATICSRTILKGQKLAYISSCRKLRNMYEDKILKRYTFLESKEYIYQVEKKQIGIHQKILIDLYSKIFELVDEVLFFNPKETSWRTAKRKSDGHIIYRINKDIYSLLIEIDYTHATSQKKLMDIYQSGEVHEWYKNNYNTDNYFPSFLIVSLLGDTKYENVPFTYNTLDFEFTNIEQILGLK